MEEELSDVRAQVAAERAAAIEAGRKHAKDVDEIKRDIAEKVRTCSRQMGGCGWVDWV